jgi:hypothetical protein
MSAWGPALGTSVGCSDLPRSVGCGEDQGKEAMCPRVECTEGGQYNVVRDTEPGLRAARRTPC